MSRSPTTPARSPQLLSGPRAVQAQQLRLATLIAIAQEEAATVRRRRSQRIWGVSVFVALSSVGIVFQSCAGSKSGAQALDNGDEAVVLAEKKTRQKKSTGTEDTGAKPDKSTFDQAATDLQALFDARLADSSEAPAVGPGTPALQPDPAAAPRPSSRWEKPRPATPTPEPAAPPEPAAAAPGAEPTAGASIAMAVDVPVSPAKSVEARRAELTAELAGLLKPDAASNPDVLHALSSLIALEAVTPGAATTEIEAALKPLSPDEAAAARVARDIVRSISADSKLLADPTALREELTRHLERLTESDAAAGDLLTLNTAALCTRVESFGRYTPYSGNRFLAGRANPAIVYVEVDHFTQRPMSELLTPTPGLDSAHGDEEALAVELTMRAELYHDDGSRQWRSAEAVIRDTSRTRRRDFFLVQRIDLPANLSVGKYNLKVTVRDRLATDGGAEAEMTIPIQLVADAALLGGNDPTPSRPASKPVFNAPTAGPEPLKPMPAGTPVVARPRPQH